MAEEELWDREQIATYLGCSVNTVNAWLLRNGVPVAGHGPVVRGRVRNLYSAEGVRAAKAAMPGKGRRRVTDA